MKKFFALLSFVLAAFLGNAQPPVVVVNSDITVSQTWTNDKIYKLTGPTFIYVRQNKILTIQPGTTIISDYPGLIVTRGSKINAIGTATQPIVFTSSKSAGSRNAGDWGGLVILGKAPINDPAGERLIEGCVSGTYGLYGGTNPADNSGQLKYVRIEYAGIACLPNNETNGLTLGGVGTGTKINYVQVSRGGDDSFEWFGGTVNAKYLVAYAGLDDDFDTDYGFSGTVQFGISLRDPNAADISGSNGFESDNDATGTTNSPFTNATFSNITSFGPIQTGNTGSYNANYKRGLHERRSTKQDIRNSVIVGWPFGARVESTNSCSYLTTELLLEDNIFAGNTTLSESGSCSTLAAYLNAENQVLPNAQDVKYADPYAVGINPNFTLQTTSPAKTGGVALGAPFTATTYRGAASTIDWTDCWATFDPQTEVYGATAPINYAVAAGISPNTPQTISAGGSVLFTATPNSAGYKFQWYKGTAKLAGKTQSTYTATAAGDYKCLVTSPRGCTAYTPAVTVTVLSPKVGGSNNVLFADEMTAFPNPSKGAFTLRFDLNEELPVEISVLDMNGKTVVRTQAEGILGINEVRMTNELPAGFYLVRVNAGEQMLQTRVTVQ